MKVKCYAIYDATNEVLAEYANPSQKNFLSFELNNALRKFKRTDRIEFEHTSNGVWYCRLSPHSRRAHLVLLGAEAASLPLAASLLNKGIQFESATPSLQKLRMRLAEQVKVVNANAKVEALNENVMELESLMKGNVGKMMSNMSDLETAEKKSERLSSLSRQFETDSRALEEKMKRKACVRRMLMGGGAALLLFLLYYFLF